MQSAVLQALIIDAVVLGAVVEADFGAHRKIGKLRILRPLFLAAGIVPLYLKDVTTHGTGLTLEIALTAAGIVLGLVATALMSVYRSPKTGRAVSRAGAGYVGLWTLVIGARAAFSYGSYNWFAPSLGRWMVRNAVTSDAITDALIFMAVAMLVIRTVGLIVRANGVRSESATVAGPYARSV
jgi:hypothetical protein